MCQITATAVFVCMWISVSQNSNKISWTKYLHLIIIVPRLADLQLYTFMFKLIKLKLKKKKNWCVLQRINFKYCEKTDRSVQSTCLFRFYEMTCRCHLTVGEKQFTDVNLLRYLKSCSGLMLCVSHCQHQQQQVCLVVVCFLVERNFKCKCPHLKG